jgi:hypothetical protein
MQQQYQAIGEAAGKIFRALEKGGAVTIIELQSETKIADTVLFNQALGWLAREEKLNFTKSAKTLKVSLLGAIASR